MDWNSMLTGEQREAEQQARLRYIADYWPRPWPPCPHVFLIDHRFGPYTYTCQECGLIILDAPVD